jgi:hypothetical protein
MDGEIILGRLQAAPGVLGAAEFLYPRQVRQLDRAGHFRYPV